MDSCPLQSSLYHEPWGLEVSREGQGRTYHNEEGRVLPRSPHVVLGLLGTQLGHSAGPKDFRPLGEVQGPSQCILDRLTQYRNPVGYLSQRVQW